ncbi:hypothetical protein RM572_00725 [Streptomyces sp. DSM 42041]|uniref:DUF7352 domain-containing protein n=1 Tax=Streptomyces hazeniae TaxID=3075538 RepID=A0ABU2NKN6_9ACTN|nr:hypothetical protein [Streptomyces sp. DSM 42041]MDT0377299.1 hypothetical protein [Streptomyces sp. DSM 42041]
MNQPDQQPPAIYRYEVPVDDEWHQITGCATPLHTACRDPRVVEFWAWHRPDLPARHFRVFGTGHPAPEHAEHRGTALAAAGHLVWHLMETRTPEAPMAGPADFFQPGHTYGPHLIRFRCDAITTHPATGERQALGWLRFTDGTWKAGHLGPKDWADGSWAENTAGARP